jgi:GT2 family glycosyltransferase/glycosyltransferase involved in cell wall biosynthesis
MPESHSSLDYLFSDDLAPLFWMPKRTAQSAWQGHIPFAHWLVHVARPGTLVELGTYSGASYSAFCEAVEKTKIDTHCFAVDTWKGDKHSGFYGEELFTEFRTFHDENFSSFSKVVRAEFDDAVREFEDGKIDLIHFDGLHTYDAVRHDFETWLPKLSERAIALFHDTNERRADFGVWRFWSELQQRYPSFEFLHSHGLGVLCVGQNAPSKVKALCSLESTERIAAVRNLFETIGLQWSEQLSIAEQNQSRENALRDGLATEHASAIAVRDAKIFEQQEEISACADQIRANSQQISELEKQNDGLTARLRAQESRLANIDAALKNKLAALDEIKRSTSWRLTKPLRSLSTAATSALRRVRRTGRALKMIGTGRWGELAQQLLYYYQRHTPLAVKEMVPRSMAYALKQRIDNSNATSNSILSDRSPRKTLKMYDGRFPKVKGPNVLLCGHAAGSMLFGGERSFVDVAISLSSLRLNLFVTIPSFENLEYVELLKGHCTGLILAPPHGWKAGADHIQLVRYFKAIISDLSIDLVYANTITLRAPQIAAKELGVKSVCHARELVSSDAQLRERIGLSSAEIVADVVDRSTAIVANSNLTAAAFPGGRVFVVPNVIDTATFDIPNELDEILRFGIISSNQPKKGIEDFVAVAQGCFDRRLKAQFVIYGPESELIDGIRRKGLPGNLTVAGYAPTPQSALQGMNVLLSLSHVEESFGRTVAEALAARRPVIAYRWGAIPEIVLDGKTGFLVPHCSIGEVVDAVERFVRNKHLINEFGERGRAWVTDNIAPSIYSRKMHECVEDLVGHIAKRVEEQERVTIIVPVYNAAEDVRACLRSLERWTDLSKNRVLVIDDKSTDSTVASIIEEFASRPGFFSLQNEENLGYVKTINKGIEWAGRDDVVLLNSDAIVTPRWLEALVEAAAPSDIGTVTAMSDHAGAFSFPEPHQRNERPRGLDLETWANALVQEARAFAPVEVPTGNGFCLFVRRKAFEQVGYFDAERFPRGYGEENEFCMRATKRGWRHVISTGSYVYHERSKSFGSERPKLAAKGLDVVTSLYPSYMSEVKRAFGSEHMMRLRGAMSLAAEKKAREHAVASDEQRTWAFFGNHIVDWSAIDDGLAKRMPGRTSIIVCAYNNAALTRRCLESILDAGIGTDDEIVLVDNGSDADLIASVTDLEKKHNNLKIVRNEKNYNFAIGNNIGFGVSTGGRIVFLNNDTEVKPGWLEPLVSALDTPSVLGAQPKLLYPTGNVQSAGVVFSGRSALGYALYADVPGHDPRVQQPRRTRAVTAACLAIGARDFAGARGFDPIYINGQEDIDLCLRLGAGKSLFQYVPQSVVIHHEGRTSGRGRHVLDNRRVFAARWKGRFEGDDTIHYRRDGTLASNYSGDRPEPDIAIWKPGKLARI